MSSSFTINGGGTVRSVPSSEPSDKSGSSMCSYDRDLQQFVTIFFVIFVQLWFWLFIGKF